MFYQVELKKHTNQEYMTIEKSSLNDALCLADNIEKEGIYQNIPVELICVEIRRNNAQLTQ